MLIIFWIKNIYIYRWDIGQKLTRVEAKKQQRKSTQRKSLTGK